MQFKYKLSIETSNGLSHLGQDTFVNYLCEAQMLSTILGYLRPLAAALAFALAFCAGVSFLDLPRPYSIPIGQSKKNNTIKLDNLLKDINYFM